MGEPSLFCVGGSQPNVMLAVVAAFGGGVSVEEAPVVVVVGEPLPFELPLEVSATDVDVVELALVLLVVATPAAPAALSSPQPASAIARLPINDAITTRSAPIPRLACLITNPRKCSSTSGQAWDEATNRGCTSLRLRVQLA